MSKATSSKLAAKAMDFASYIIESGEEPEQIILFGSAARGDADSDIDVFVGTKDGGKIEGLKKNFELAKENQWKLKGVDNPISLVTGRLDDKKMGSLRPEIESGIVLYGVHKKTGQNLRAYSLFALNFEKLTRAQRVKAWRKLYGYKQKVGQKTYVSKGLVEKAGGKKIEKGVVFIPAEKSKEFATHLQKNKTGFKIQEIWGE